MKKEIDIHTSHFCHDCRAVVCLRFCLTLMTTLKILKQTQQKLSLTYPGQIPILLPSL